MNFAMRTFLNHTFLLAFLLLACGCGNSEKAKENPSQNDANPEVSEQTEPDLANIDSISAQELREMIENEPDKAVEKYSKRFVQVTGEVEKFHYLSTVLSKDNLVVLLLAGDFPLYCMVKDKSKVESFYPQLKVTVVGKVKRNDYQEINFEDVRLVKSEGKARAFTPEELGKIFDEGKPESLRAKPLVIVNAKMSKQIEDNVFEMAIGVGEPLQVKIFSDAKDVTVGEPISILGTVEPLTGTIHGSLVIKK